MSPILQTLANGSAYGYRTLASAAAGAYESIATATPSGTGTVTFSSIPATYSSLQIRFSLITSSSGWSSYLRFNGDTGNNYVYHYIAGTGTAAAAAGVTANPYIDFSSLYSGSNTTNPSVGIIDIHEYASTTKNKVIRDFAGIDKNGSGDVSLISGLWLNTDAITSISLIVPVATFSTGTTFSLYGIKGA
jgi:hypothetical protein